MCVARPRGCELEPRFSEPPRQRRVSTERAKYTLTRRLAPWSFMKAWDLRNWGQANIA